MIKFQLIFFLVLIHFEFMLKWCAKNELSFMLLFWWTKLKILGSRQALPNSNSVGTVLQLSSPEIMVYSNCSLYLSRGTHLGVPVRPRWWWCFCWVCPSAEWRGLTLQVTPLSKGKKTLAMHLLFYPRTLHSSLQFQNQVLHSTICFMQWSRYQGTDDPLPQRSKDRHLLKMVLINFSLSTFLMTVKFRSSQIKRKVKTLISLLLFLSG